jgi:Glycosyl hydrolase family 79 C-terminal beta domain
MFARAAPPGSQLLRTSGGHLRSGLSVWATRAPGGQVRAVLVNESPSNGQRVSLSPPAGAGTSATVLRMRAPSVSAQGHVSIGGASFGPETSTGVLPPAQAQPATAKRGLYTIPMPPGSAALVTFSTSS